MLIISLVRYVSLFSVLLRTLPDTDRLQVYSFILIIIGWDGESPSQHSYMQTHQVCVDAVQEDTEVHASDHHQASCKSGSGLEAEHHMVANMEERHDLMALSVGKFQVIG